MQKLFTIIRNSNVNALATSNLHRWGNHFNRNCIDRIDRCMSIQWNDYNSDSRNDKINENRTKKIDQEYGHLFKTKNNNLQKKSSEKDVQDYNYKYYSKKEFENYFNLEMRASMMM